MDFITGLLVTTNRKSKSFKLILIIVERLTKIVHYKPVKIIIDTLSLAEIIIDIVLRHHGLFDSIVSN